MATAQSGVTTLRADDQRGHLYRLLNKETGQYLHLGATQDTDGTTWAWSGTKTQAQTLKDRAKVRGETFPYMLVRL